MRKEYAGLPLYVWVVLLAVAGGMYHFHRSQKNGTPLIPNFRQNAPEVPHEGPADTGTDYEDSLTGLTSIGAPLNDAVINSPHVLLPGELWESRRPVGNADMNVPPAPNYSTAQEAL